MKLGQTFINTYALVDGLMIQACGGRKCHGCTIMVEDESCGGQKVLQSHDVLTRDSPEQI